ncbi:DUF1090 family protein [Candidatus Erwinia dacicola]|uniref:DUF1090 family protein n=1 Tax=Candidatus Erwinia dacicola TaxID=252393 RepID=UPI0030B7F5E2
MDLAQKHDKQRRVTRLERALTETRTTCSDACLRDARQEKINQHQRKVAEHERELKQVADGDN